MSCVVSMRSKVYLPVCVYDDNSHVLLPAPDSKCDCVCGEECSHRLAAGDLFHGFLQMLPETTTYEQFLEFMPDSVAIIMSEPIPIDHIFSYEADRWQDVKSMDYADVGVKGKRSKRFKRRENINLTPSMLPLIAVHMATAPASAAAQSTAPYDCAVVSQPPEPAASQSTEASRTPAVGDWLKLIWPEDGVWYRAKVVEYTQET